jgi:hypothetical protein
MDVILAPDPVGVRQYLFKALSATSRRMLCRLQAARRREPELPQSRRAGPL